MADVAYFTLLATLVFVGGGCCGWLARMTWDAAHAQPRDDRGRFVKR